MNFNKAYSKYKKLYTENIQEGIPMQGEQVVFIKGWEKDPYMESLANTSTGQRIREMIEQGDDPLIVTGIQFKKAHAYGSFGSVEHNSINNEEHVFVTVSQQYAIGLYSNVVVVPASILQCVENGINMPSLSKNQNKEYKQTTGEEPTIDKSATDPTTQTHASWKDNGINKLG